MPETKKKPTDGDEAYLRGLTEEAQAQRKRELAAIHAAKRDLGLDDAQYRDLLEAWTGRRSAKYMRARERRRVIENFRKMGFPRRGREGKGKGGRSVPAGAVHPAEVERPQRRLIVKLWRSLYAAGKVETPTREALDAFVERQTGVVNVKGLETTDANIVIESLKKWLKRS